MPIAQPPQSPTPAPPHGSDNNSTDTNGEHDYDVDVPTPPASPLPLPAPSTTQKLSDSGAPYIKIEQEAFDDAEYEEIRKYFFAKVEKIVPNGGRQLRGRTGMLILPYI